MGETNDPQDDEEQEEWDKGWYGESLKETATKLGYLGEDEQGLDFDTLENDFLNDFDEYSALREIEPGIYRLKFPYARREFDDVEWEEMLGYIKEKGFEILDASNYYERNWEPEEPPEAVPTIEFKKPISENLENGEGEEDRD